MACYLPTGTDGERDLGLAFNEEVSSSLCRTLSVNDGFVSCSVLLRVLDSICSSGGSLSSALLLGLLALSLVVSEKLSVSGALLLEVFGDDSCPKTNTNVMLVSNQRQPQLRAAAVKASESTICFPAADRCSSPSNGPTDSEKQ
jgi:hypothetical protein